MMIKVLGEEIDIMCLTEDIAEVLKFEGVRLQSIIERGFPVIAETRIWDRKRGITVSRKLTV